MWNPHSRCSTFVRETMKGSFIHVRWRKEPFIEVSQELATVERSRSGSK
jgi:hypothetical protein